MKRIMISFAASCDFKKEVDDFIMQNPEFNERSELLRATIKQYLLQCYHDIQKEYYQLAPK